MEGSAEVSCQSTAECFPVKIRGTFLRAPGLLKSPAPVPGERRSGPSAAAGGRRAGLRPEQIQTGIWSLRKRILGGIQHALRPVEIDLGKLHADVLEHLVQRLSVMAEGHRAVMRIIFSRSAHDGKKRPISGMAKMPMPPKERVATGRTSPWAM